MSTAPAGKVWLVLVGTFVAGAIFGGFASLRIAKTVVDHGRGPDQFVPRHLERLTEELELTEAQRTQVGAYMSATWEDLAVHRNASIEEMRKLEARIMSVLTDAQKTEYAEMQEKQRERWRRLMDRRKSHKDGKREGHQGPPPPPGADRPEGPPLGEEAASMPEN